MNKYDQRKLQRIKESFDELPESLRAEFQDHILGIMTDKAIETKKQFEFVPMSEYREEGLKILKNWGKFQGISSGFPSLDKLTKGFVGGEVVIIAAKTTVGKTALAANIANNAAINGIPVLFVTLEMTKGQLTSRYLHINGDDVTDDYLHAEANTVFQKEDELNWESIDGLIGSFCKDLANGLVVIDHLHYFTRELDNVSEDLGRITKELKKNAIRHDVPILLISHVRKTNGAISIEDLRGSSYVAQDADIVLTCGRSEDGTKLGIKIEKNRNRGFDYQDNEIELNYDATKITELYDVFGS